MARALIGAVADAARARGAARLYGLTQEHNTPARTLCDKLAQYQGVIRYDHPLQAAPAGGGASRMASPAFTGWQRSQGGVEVPTGGICVSAQEPASARHPRKRAPRSADLVRCQGRRSQSG